MKKRLLSLIFALVMSFSFFAGCSGNASVGEQIANSNPNASTQTTGDEPADEGYYPDIRKFTEGIHVLTAPETENYIVKDGVTDYSIVIPQGASSLVQTAKDEFKTLFLEATGINLPVIVEGAEGLTHTAEGKYISFGDTKLLQSARETTDADLEATYSVLKSNGLRIVTVDNTIYLYGCHDYGVVSAVYTFMQICFNFDMYYYDTWDLDTGVLNMKLRNFDVTDVPDVEFRGTGYGYIRSNYKNNSLYRFRTYTGSYGGLFFPTYSQPGCQGTRTSIHNTDEMINEYTPGYNKDWVSDNGNQLCYTGHGNPESYEGLVEACAKKCIESYVKEADAAGGPEKIAPEKRYFAITIEDNAQTCTCPSCYAAEIKYGQRSGAVVILCNDVMSYIVDYWMNTEEGLPYKNDKLYMSFFAYHEFVAAPSHYDEATGKYVPNHPDVQPRPDISCFFCFSGAQDRNMDYYDPSNEWMRTQVLSWGDLCGDMIIWGYQANFTTFTQNGLTWNFYDSDCYQMLAHVGSSFGFVQTQGSDKDVSNFDAFRAYLEAKYWWDSTYDYEELRQKYFKAMFREAADIMMDYQDYYTMYWNNFLARQNWIGKRPQSNKQQFHPVNELRKRMEYCDRALALIESIYKDTNPEIYEKIKFHIELEWLNPAYQLHYYYTTDYIPEDEYYEIEDRLRQLGKKVGQISEGEGDGGAISSYIKNL